MAEQTLSTTEVVGVLARMQAGTADPPDAARTVHATWGMYLHGLGVRPASPVALRAYAKTLSFLADEIASLPQS